MKYIYIYLQSSDEDDDEPKWVEKASERKTEEKPLIKGPRLEVFQKFVIDIAQSQMIWGMENVLYKHWSGCTYIL